MQETNGMVTQANRTMADLTHSMREIAHATQAFDAVSVNSE